MELEAADKPVPLLPTSAVPCALVPIKLPCTMLFEELKNATPTDVLPESMFRACDIVPPIVLFDEPLSASMPRKFAAAALPALSVPIQLPSILLPLPLPR